MGYTKIDLTARVVSQSVEEEEEEGWGRFLSIDSCQSIPVNRLEPVDMVDMGLEIERAAEVCSLARLDHLRIEGRRAVEFIAFVCGRRCWC